MKIKLVLVTLSLLAIVFSPAIVRAQNKLSKTEVKDGWQLLFDGKTIQGWRDASKDTLPKKSWRIANGELLVEPKKEGVAGGRGDIVTQKLYNDFELSVEFKISAGGNSGIKYFVNEKGLGLEYQIIDDALHADAKLGKNGNRTLSSLYDLIPASSAKIVKPVGQWNTARIISNGHHVEHWLNGELVLEYERGSDSFINLIKESKYKDIAGFGLISKGRILLQDHGDAVSFRNIKIKELQNQ
jgi:hypothetical protein